MAKNSITVTKDHIDRLLEKLEDLITEVATLKESTKWLKLSVFAIFGFIAQQVVLAITK